MTVHPIENIRNFSIVAHIDHGKSTLADRLIQTTGGLAVREMKEQVLDSMEIERERGITIKAQTVRLSYSAKDGKTYTLNLMDTPGHVDFAYEVSRCLAACEGALLVVDASQGVEAQTLANVYQAIDAGLEIVPVLNKVDLPAAEPERVRQQIEDVIGLDASHAIPISAKTGLNIEEVLEAIVHRLPPPEGDADAPLKALLIDSWYDAYLGVIVLVRIFDGALKKGQRIRMMAAGAAYNVERVGVFTPKGADRQLGPGEVGFITAQIKEVAETHVGDTITDDRKPAAEALPGFKPAQQVVFCGLFPADAADFEDLARSAGPAASQRRELHLRDGDLRRARLRLSLRVPRPPASGDHPRAAGARIRPRPDRHRAERHLPHPSDRRHDDRAAQSGRHARGHQDRQDRGAVDPRHHLRARRVSGRGAEAVRGPPRLQIELTYAGSRAMVVYRLPLNEVVFDFYDRLKSVCRGYASFDYHIEGLSRGRPGQDVDPGQRRAGRRAVDDRPPRARRSARPRMCEKLKELIPRHLFQIPIQAAIGGKIIARETISALRKDVTAKCYGGDITRKRKLLDKQKEGKKKMRQFGKVDIPRKPSSRR